MTDILQGKQVAVRYVDGVSLEVHHIEPFVVVELRAELSNLVLLCTACHDWVHGKLNTERLYLGSVA